MRHLLIVLGIVVLIVAAALVYVAQPVRVRTRPPQLPADGERLRRSVEEVVGFTPRDSSHPENLARLAERLAERFRHAGGRTSFQRFRIVNVEYRNVIASFGPETGERIVVGAHYDAAGVYPGADDNASGVAVLLELAAMLGRQAPARRVDLVAYTLEEPPFFRTEQMGSWVHAQSLRDEAVAVRAMISVEMVGYFSDEPGSQQFPAAPLRAVYGDRGNFIVVVGRTGDAALLRTVKEAMSTIAGVPVPSINAPRAVPGVDFSDHASYWDHGYPALMVTDSSFYRNPHYHTADDTPQTLDYRRMAIVAEQLHAAVLALAK